MFRIRDVYYVLRNEEFECTDEFGLCDLVVCVVYEHSFDPCGDCVAFLRVCGAGRAGRR